MQIKGLLLKDDFGDQCTNRDIIESNRIIHLAVISALADYSDLATSESIIEKISMSVLAHPHIRNGLLHMWVSFAINSWSYAALVRSTIFRGKSGVLKRQMRFLEQYHSLITLDTLLWVCT